MGGQEDIEDMLAFQQGNEEGFHRLFQRYSKPIINYLYRFTWDRSVAEDLTQEVFLRICRAAKTYEPKTSFRTWLYTIATNVARNEFRRQEHTVRHESLSAPLYEDRMIHQEDRMDPTAETPEGMAIGRQLEEHIQRALSMLPERQRTALLLCRHHTFSYQEVADIMNLRVGAVKSLIHRATETLRRELAPYLDTAAEERGTHAM